MNKKTNSQLAYIKHSLTKRRTIKSKNISKSIKCMIALMKEAIITQKHIIQKISPLLGNKLAIYTAQKISFEVTNHLLSNKNLNELPDQNLEIRMLANKAGEFNSKALYIMMEILYSYPNKREDIQKASKQMDQYAQEMWNLL